MDLVLIYEQILMENALKSDIINVIDNHIMVEINYKGDEEVSRGRRVIEVYALGNTKSGNPCIRAYQLYGKSETIAEGWKIFRLDRISQFSVLTKLTFDRPRPKYNQFGDDSFQNVQHLAKF